MAKQIGEWILGDHKGLKLNHINSDGTPFNLTGANVTLEGLRRDKDVSLAISVGGGLSATPQDGVATFSNITVGLSLGSANRQVFECRSKVVIGGNPRWSDAFEIAVVTWP